MVDKIRKALDRAREERGTTSRVVPEVGAVAAAKVTEFAPGAAANISGRKELRLQRIRSRAFDADPDLLERHRVVLPSRESAAASAYRMLRTQVLQRMAANGWSTLAVFSPGVQDGKTTTAINLALSMAGDPLHTVLLVELDLRNPTLAARFGLVPEHGCDDALTGDAAVQDCLYYALGLERLLIMPARRAVDNSSEMLAGQPARDLVAELRMRYPERIVIFDLPPVLVADDALVFAPLVECGLVVAAEGRTRRTDLARTIELLHRTSLVGTVLNRSVAAPASY